jgi:hypothetical protein
MSRDRASLLKNSNNITALTLNYVFLQITESCKIHNLIAILTTTTTIQWHPELDGVSEFP